jgi:hypothetical protein
VAGKGLGIEAGGLTSMVLSSSCRVSPMANPM